MTTESNHNNRGVIIVFEGLDKSGKSTQANLLYEHLKCGNVECELWKFPDRSTPRGIEIDKYLKKNTELGDEVIHELFSANRWEVADILEMKIKSGISIIIDRYAYSGVAYTAAKGYDIEWCKSHDKGLPRPDLLFFMNSVNCAELTTREGYGDERYEELTFQSKVYDKFVELLRSCNTVWLGCSHSNSDIIDIHNTVVMNVKLIMNTCRTNKIEYLW